MGQLGLPKKQLREQLARGRRSRRDVLLRSHHSRQRGLDRHDHPRALIRSTSRDAWRSALEFNAAESVVAAGFHWEATIPPQCMPQYAAVRSKGSSSSSRVEPLDPSAWKVESAAPVVTLTSKVLPCSLDVSLGKAQPGVSIESNQCFTKAGGLYQYKGKCRTSVEAVSYTHLTLPTSPHV